MSVYVSKCASWFIWERYTSGVTIINFYEQRLHKRLRQKNNSGVEGNLVYKKVWFGRSNFCLCSLL